jgi:hypothetical protein
MGLKKLIFVLSILLSLTAMNVFGFEDDKDKKNEIVLTEEDQKLAKERSEKPIEKSFSKVYFYLMPSPLKEKKNSIFQTATVNISFKNKDGLQSHVFFKRIGN